jgi:predicted dehydrogenase
MKFTSRHHPALRVGYHCAGRMGFWHGRAACRLGAEIIWIADPNAERVKALGRALRTQCMVADGSTLLRVGGIDAVHICSPLSSHIALARC